MNEPLLFAIRREIDLGLAAAARLQHEAARRRAAGEAPDACSSAAAGDTPSPLPPPAPAAPRHHRAAPAEVRAQYSLQVKARAAVMRIADRQARQQQQQLGDAWRRKLLAPSLLHVLLLVPVLAAFLYAYAQSP